MTTLEEKPVSLDPENPGSFGAFQERYPEMERSAQWARYDELVSEFRRYVTGEVTELKVIIDDEGELQA